MQSHQECYEDNEGVDNSIVIGLCLLFGHALMGQRPKMLHSIVQIHFSFFLNNDYAYSKPQKYTNRCILHDSFIHYSINKEAISFWWIWILMHEAMKMGLSNTKFKLHLLLNISMACQFGLKSVKLTIRRLF